MSLKLSDDFKKAVLQGLAPIQHEGKPYMGYDSMQLSKDGPYLVLRFLRYGVEQARMETPFPDFDKGSTVTLAQVEGRIQVSIA